MIIINQNTIIQVVKVIILNDDQFFIISEFSKKRKMEHLQAFTEHLRNQLSFKAFQSLPNSLGITLYRLNKLLKGKEDWRLGEIQHIAQLLDKDPLALIEEWQLGYQHITLLEMNILLAARGKRLSFEEQVSS